MEKYLQGVLESMGALTIEDILLRIGVSVIFALAIFVSYRLTHSGSVYSAKFNITLVTLTILTTMVMTVIGNNLALSLGMVGALSIIRLERRLKIAVIQFTYSGQLLLVFVAVLVILLLQVLVVQ